MNTPTGSPFLFLIPATGERPLKFSAKGLPAGLALEAATGRITVPKMRRTHFFHRRCRSVREICVGTGVFSLLRWVLFLGHGHPGIGCSRMTRSVNQGRSLCTSLADAEGREWVAPSNRGVLKMAMTRILRRFGGLPVAAFCCMCVGILQAQESVPEPHAPAAPPAKPAAWTYDEAFGQLRLYPHDPYLQFVPLQLAQRDGRTQEAADAIRRLLPTVDPRMQRAQEVDLFSLFSGALAVQESLQLDTMVGPSNETRSVEMDRFPPVNAPGRPMAKVPATPTPRVPREPERPVPLSDLQGPTVQSHPWTEMLAGRTPAMSPLAGCVPQDFYYIQFRSVNKMLALLEQGDVWGTHLFSQTVRKAYRHDVRDRLLRQLAVETNQLLQPFYDLVIQETAVVGSDLFATEGSDVTLLFRVRQPACSRRRWTGS